jgi:hypothetical protein
MSHHNDRLSAGNEEPPESGLERRMSHRTQPAIRVASTGRVLDDNRDPMLLAEVVPQSLSSAQGCPLVGVGQELLDQVASQAKLGLGDALQASQFH